jgi:hypothetical protein
MFLEDGLQGTLGLFMAIIDITPQSQYQVFSQLQLAPMVYQQSLAGTPSNPIPSPSKTCPAYNTEKYFSIV